MTTLLLSSCWKTHMRSESICEGKVHLEFYEEFDMGVCYVTDSVNYRVKAFRFNLESEYTKYYCSSDSLTMELWSSYPSPNHVLKTKTFYIKN